MIQERWSFALAVVLACLPAISVSAADVQAAARTYTSGANRVRLLLEPEMAGAAR